MTIDKMPMALAGLLAVGALAMPAPAAAQTGARGTTPLTCASSNNQRQTCLIDTRGGVRLVRQISDAACTEGRTWGTEPRGVWVDRGCRAEFEVTRASSGGGWNGVPPVGSGNNNGNGWGNAVSPEITCASDNNGYKECPVSGTWRQARLVRQTSTAACTEGGTWGWRSDRIWVSKGCRGVFQARNNAGTGNYGVQRVSCSSSGATTRCPADVESGVRLVKQVSSAQCVQGRSWGTQPGSIWVSQGCRAEFEVGRRRPVKPVRPSDDYYGGGAGGSQIVTCGSSSVNARSSCPTGGRAVSVQVSRERSSGRCTEGSGWGWTAGEIWTARGCVADFRVRRQ